MTDYSTATWQDLEALPAGTKPRTPAMQAIARLGGKNAADISALAGGTPAGFGGALDTRWYAVDTGAANAIVISPQADPSGQTLTDQFFIISVAADNTGATTIDVGSTDAAVPLVDATGASLGAGALASGMLILAQYVSARGAFVLMGRTPLPPLVTQAEAEAGTETAARMWSPERDAQALDAHVTAILTRIYPVGSIYITASPDTPADTFGFGVWTKLEGRFIVGHKGGDTDFGTIHATGGTKTETLTNAQAPSHSHTQAAHRHHLPGGDGILTYDPQKQGAWYMSPGGGHEAGMVSHTAYETPTIHSTGGGQSHNNLPPYAVFNIWERTA